MLVLVYVKVNDPRKVEGDRVGFNITKDPWFWKKKKHHVCLKSWNIITTTTMSCLYPKFFVKESQSIKIDRSLIF